MLFRHYFTLSMTRLNKYETSNTANEQIPDWEFQTFLTAPHLQHSSTYLTIKARSSFIMDSTHVQKKNRFKKT